YGDHRDLHSFPTRRSSDLLEDWRFEKSAVIRLAARRFQSTPALEDWRFLIDPWAHRSQEMFQSTPALEDWRFLVVMVDQQGLVVSIHASPGGLALRTPSRRRSSICWFQSTP